VFRHETTIAILLLGTAPVAAQSPVGLGVTLGAARLSDARTEQAVTGVIQLRPRPWLALSAIPTLIRVSDDTAGTNSTSRGLGDLPLIAGATATLPSRWAPTIGGALIVSLPTGNSNCGLGSGQTTVGIDGGVGIAATANLRLSADASRNLSGLAGQTSFTPSQATSLRLEAAADVAPRWTLGLSAGMDVGTADSTQALSRVAAVGITHAIAGALALTVDASHGLTTASPRWVVSVGLGTVFSGISPVSPTSPLRRLKNSFGSTGSRSRNKIGACG
jgi:hypothetical protein